MIRIILALVVLASVGCASLNSVSITPVPAKRDNTVKATADRWIIMGLNFDNDFVDRVSSELASKCPGGKVSGILTKDELYMYFLFFVIKRQVTASGFCESKERTAMAASPKKGGRKVNSDEDPVPASEDSLQ